MRPVPDPTPADGGLLQLVFCGESLPGFDKPTVRLTVERMLELDAAHSAHLFSGQRVILRQGLVPADAARYVEQFARMGAVLRMEPDAGPPDPPRMAPPEGAWQATAASRRPWGRLLLAALAMVLLVLAARSLTARPAAPPVAASPAPPPARRVMSPEAAEALAGPYAQAEGHKAFAVAGILGHGWVASAPSATAAAAGALAECQADRQPYAPACKLVDRNGSAVEP